MVNRTGTYIAFHADGKKEPTESDMKYYQLLKAWNVRSEQDFSFIDSHKKTAALRDSSKRATVEARLKERLRKSKNMILIIGKTTHLDTDWVPLEISYAIDECKIAIIAAYTGFKNILAPQKLSHLWPKALSKRINDETAHVIHTPFKQPPLKDAVSQFSHTAYPKGGGLGVYKVEVYKKWGLYDEKP